MERSFSFHTLVKLLMLTILRMVNFILFFDLPLEIDRVTSKLSSQKLSAEFYDSNPETMFTQITELINTIEPQFLNYCGYCLNPITLFQIVFANNANTKKENGIHIADQNHLRTLSIKTLRQTKIKFIHMINLYPTL